MSSLLLVVVVLVLLLLLLMVVQDARHPRLHRLPAAPWGQQAAT